MQNDKMDNIFQNKGFVLFEFLLEDYVKKTRGRYAEIAYYYWRLRADNYIIVSPKVFQAWYSQNYNEDIGKIKSLSVLEKPNRKTNYLNAVIWLNSENRSIIDK